MAGLIFECRTSQPKIDNLFPFLMRFFIITRIAICDFGSSVAGKQAIERHLTLESARRGSMFRWMLEVWVHSLVLSARSRDMSF